MKTITMAAIVALGVGTCVAGIAKADDFGERLGRGVLRGVTGDDGRDFHRHYRDEGRSAYEGDCQTVVIRRQTPDGEVIQRTRRCD